MKHMLELLLESRDYFFWLGNLEKLGINHSSFSVNRLQSGTQVFNFGITKDDRNRYSENAKVFIFPIQHDALINNGP